MKIFYKIAGIIFVIGSSLFMNNNFKEIEAYHNGHLISATVIFVPNCITTKKHYNLKFEYKGKEHGKEIGVQSCKELKEGDVIKLRTNKENSVFLYENENPYNNATSFIVLFLFGVFLIYMGFKK